MEILAPFFTAEIFGKAMWIWLLFAGVVAALLAFDLGVLHKDDHEIGVKTCRCLPATSPSRCRSALGYGGTWAHRAR